MADIQSKIMSKYGIDIAQENIFKLYKIESVDVSEKELQEKIEATRKRWNQSINGANEKNAERDRARLEKADKYEAILKDAKLRKEVFSFYNGGDNKKNEQSGETPTGIDFAREYFKLIETSKKLKKEDVEFFFNYYQSERKNKKYILGMLEREFKIAGLKQEEKKFEDDTDVDPEGKTKDESSPLIVNLFQEATIIKLRKVFEFYEKAVQSNDIRQKYPTLEDGLYSFLELKTITDIDKFNAYISDKSKEAYSVRQEKGNEYIALVDMFNTLQVLGTYRDVVDNIEEFKLLIKYPNLTPYMYAFVEMKPGTLKGIVNVAKREYSFRDDTDFILNYYNPVHDNFGITNSGISSIIRKAEKKAKQNKVLNDIDEKLGRKKKRNVSIGAEVIHWMVYWPIFLVYLVFETFKAIFTELHKFTYPIFAIVVVALNWLLPKLGIENLLYLRKIFSKDEWYAFLEAFLGDPISTGYQGFLISLIVIIGMLAIYVLPAVVVAFFVHTTAEIINKQYDWIGYERTFQNIFKYLKQKTEEQYKVHKKNFLKKKMPMIVINILCLTVIIAIVHFTPIGFRKFSEKTGYFQSKYEVESVETILDDVDHENATDVYNVEMVIVASEANIRSGPSVDYETIAVAKEGDIFIATGNEQEADNGRIWYEIYLDDGMTQTGWASEKVISVNE